MSISYSYTLHFEGTEEELLLRLNRLRQKVQALPIERTSEIIRVAPAASPLILRMSEKLGLPIPSAVSPYLEAIRNDDEMLRHALMLDPCFGFDVPDTIAERWMAPALAFAARSEHWRAEDYPMWIRQGCFGIGGKRVCESTYEPEFPREPKFLGFSSNRGAILGAFTDLMLRSGYVLYVHPGSGSETVTLGLCGYRTEDGDGTVWLGRGFTKTQYAKELKLAHTNVARVLDFVAEEGLLFAADDNFGYYEHRDWPRAQARLTEELLVAGIFSRNMEGIVNLALAAEGNLPAQSITVLENNAATAFDRLKDLGVDVRTPGDSDDTSC